MPQSRQTPRVWSDAIRGSEILANWVKLGTSAVFLWLSIGIALGSAVGGFWFLEGIRSGITLPLRSTTGENSMFGVNSSRPELPEDEELQLAVGRAYLFASYFHEWFFHNLRSQLVVFDMPVGEVSKRELEVLALAARGHSSKRIGRELGISESTANYHIASVKRKFKVRTRSQAIAQAVQTGLIR